MTALTVTPHLSSDVAAPTSFALAIAAGRHSERSRCVFVGVEEMNG
jgi:hypothetical protein